MSAAALVEQADPVDVARIRGARRLRMRPRGLVTMAVLVVAAIVAVPWAWHTAHEYGHTTALVFWSFAGAAPFVIWTIRVVRRGRLTPAPQSPWTRRDTLCLPVVWGLMIGQWAAAWWLLQQPGRWSALALGLVVPLAVVELLGPLHGRVEQALIALRRLRARSRDAQAVLAERELDEIAWTIANRGFQNGTALRAWIDREHPELSADVDVVPAIPGADRGFTGIKGFLPDSLAPGLRRRLHDGREITVQPVKCERGVVVTSPAGQVMEVDGIGRRQAKSFQWKGHAGTVAAARIVAGPAVIANAALAGTSASGAATRATLLVGVGERSVPLGWTADRRIRLGALALTADIPDRAGVPRLEQLVPAPSASTAVIDHSDRWPSQYRRLADAIRAELPELEAVLDLELGVEALRLSSAAAGRVVHLVPLEGPSLPFNPPPDFEAGVLIVCPDLDLIAIDHPSGSLERDATVAAVVALLRGEERRLTETVHITEKGVNAKPRRGTRPVEASGLAFGPLTVWHRVDSGVGSPAQSLGLA